MTGTSTDLRRAHVPLIAIALAGGLVRAWPLLMGGVWGTPVDYDEGVYFSAAGLLARGVWPYRDFVFVHPPGWPLLLSAIARAGPSAFLVARGLSVALGTLSLFFLGRGVVRHAGVLCGLVAAALYASYPEAAWAERGVFLEPALNLACILAAGVLLGPGEGKWRPWVAGLVLGVGISIKLLGGVWLLALLAAAWKLPGRRRQLTALLAGAAAAASLICLPFAARAPGAWFAEVIGFQLTRPADNVGGLVDRLQRIFDSGHGLAWVLALVGLASVVSTWRTASPFARAICAAWVLTVFSFLGTRAFWGQYNAHLAASEVALAALGAGELVRRWGRSALRFPLAAAALFGLLFAMRTDARRVATGSKLQPFASAAAVALRAQPCAFSFEPAWGFAADLLPGPAPYVVDPYGQMLLDATSGGARFADASAAFASEASQATVLTAISHCPVLLLGQRGRWQLSARSLASVQQRFFQVIAQRTSTDPDLWRLRPEQKTRSMGDLTPGP